jgi:hypothetical protein
MRMGKKRIKADGEPFKIPNRPLPALGTILPQGTRQPVKAKPYGRPERRGAALTACHPALFCLERGQGADVIAVSLGTLGSEASGRGACYLLLDNYCVICDNCASYPFLYTNV